MNTPLDKLRHHVTGAIERGEKEAVTEQKAQDTSPPWQLDGAVILKGTVYIASCRMDEGSISPKEEEQIAAFIVRACNSHEALVAALRTMSDGINTAFDHAATWTDGQKRNHFADLQSIASAALAQAGEGA